MLTILVSGVVSGQCDPEIQDCSESFDFSCEDPQTTMELNKFAALEILSYWLMLTGNNTVNSVSKIHVAECNNSYLIL